MADRFETSYVKTCVQTSQKKYYEGFEGLMYTILRNTSRSGTTHVIDCFIVNPQGHVIRLGANVARVLDRKYDPKYQGVKCVGCGMNMEFELVYSLSQKLFGDGYAIKQFSV